MSKPASPPPSGPADRPPPSVPREALAVGIWLYLAWGTIPAFWMMSAAVMAGINRDWLDDYLLPSQPQSRFSAFTPSRPFALTYLRKYGESQKHISALTPMRRIANTD